MKLSKPEADLFVPDGTPIDEALARTTHLGIGAHQDDLEFMSLHGILECYDRDDRWYGGVIVTNGGGSPRTGPFADFTNEQLFYLGYALPWCAVHSDDVMRTHVVRDEHAPDRFRVLGPLKNSDKFARAWQCPPGSPMNPREKCQIW